jgi:hypothetical protein
LYEHPAAYAIAFSIKELKIPHARVIGRKAGGNAAGIIGFDSTIGEN